MCWLRLLIHLGLDSDRICAQQSLGYVNIPIVGTQKALASELPVGPINSVARDPTCNSGARAFGALFIRFLMCPQGLLWLNLL